MSLPATFFKALEEIGWRADEAGGGLVLACDATAELCHLADHADWELCVLSGPRLRPPARHQVLARNARLLGPLKWVVADDGPPSCRIDVPSQSVPLGKGGWDEAAAQSPGAPWRAWAQAVTAAAMGKEADFVPQSLPLETLVGGLQQAGWVASVDDGQLRVHMQMPDLYRDIRLEQRGANDVRVAATLIELNGMAAHSRRAVFALALSANTRLNLARISVASAGKAKSLVAEVALPPCGARVLSDWLGTAVDAVHTAVSLCAREMLALRDAALAELVLASLAT